MIKIDFEFETKYGVYRDALYFDENHNLTDDEIQAIKTERLNNWLNVIENPPAPEQEIVEIDGVYYEKVYIDGQVVLKPIEAING